MAVVISAIINSVAFSGSNYLFSKLNKADYEKEVVRHNFSSISQSKNYNV